MAEERRRLQAARAGADRDFAYNASTASDGDLFSMVIQASGDVLTSWLRR
jgi:hypothetical protein